MAHRLFSDLFPPPRYLTMPAVGLDISDTVVRFAELKKRKTGYELGQFGEEKLAENVIEEGYVKDKEALTKALKNIKAKYKLHFVRASLPEEKAYLFRTQIPYMDYADIRGAVYYKLEENVPVPLADAVFDYRFIREPKRGDAVIDLSVTVIHQKVVNSYLEVLKDAGLVPTEMRIESQAITHVAVPESNTDTCIVVAVREAKTVFALVSNDVIHFSSTVAIGGVSIGDSISKNFSIGAEETKKIRQGKEVKESNEMFLSLVNAASVVRDEIQKLFAYWDSRDGEKQPIKSIIICGSDALLGLDEYLARSLEVPVRIANVWTNIAKMKDYVPPITNRDSLDYASALGLALPYD
jgi:type IV pilus assembly protein PilM